MNDRGYPETWPEFARMVLRDPVRRRNAAVLVLALAGLAVLVAAVVAGEVWFLTHVAA